MFVLMIRDMPAAPARGAGGEDHPPHGRARRRLGWLASRRQRRPSRPGVSPAVIEEEAASLLYGERTGTVNASPAVPPLADADQD